MTPCLIWTGGVNNSGYGPHRRVYERLRGPIPDGLEIDHLCRVRTCLNPDHMEPVTKRVNILRSEGTAANHASKSQCPKGHPYSGINVRGERVCGVCARDALRALSARRRIAAGRPAEARTGRPRLATCRLGHPIEAHGPTQVRYCITCRRAYQRVKPNEIGGPA